MPIDLAKLTSALHTHIECRSIVELTPEKEGGQARMKLELVLTQELPDQRLRSRWRKYPKLYQDDLPLEMFDSNRGAQAKTASSKCQKFKMESGDFHFSLMGLQTSMSLEVLLVKLDQHAYGASSQLGGKIRVADFKVSQMYLGRDILLNGSNSLGGHLGQSTIQVLHDHNKHHRRNYWLLDLYANWLQHEYKSQLSILLGKPLVAHLNSCLSH